MEYKFNTDLFILVLGQFKPIMFGYIKMTDVTLIWGGLVDNSLYLWWALLEVMAAILQVNNFQTASFVRQIFEKKST